jgi:hypothetical protein
MALQRAPNPKRINRDGTARRRGSPGFGDRHQPPKMYAQGMRNLILFALLATTLAMTACTTEPYHRVFHHPFHSHDDWERDHHR